MATKHNTKSKALKAKATRKPAKPKVTAFSRRRCEVAAVAREYEELVHAERHIRFAAWGNATDEQKTWLNYKLDGLSGTMRGHIERASQTQAYSAEGAAFQVMVLCGEIASLAALLEGKGGAFRHLDRSRRLCHSLIDYFAKALGVEGFGMCRTEFMDGTTAPLHLTRWAIRDMREAQL